MSEVKYERLYQLEKYDTCVEEIEDLLVNIRRRNNCNLFLGSRLDTCAVNFESHILMLMLEGNACVARSMYVLETSIQQAWLESSLVNFYYKIKALSSTATSVPFEVYLNSLYNALWLLWAKRLCTDEDRDALFDMLEDCFKKVLMYNNMQAKPTTYESRGKTLLSWLYSIVENITNCEIPQCFQIIDICLACLHLFLHLKLTSSEIYKSIIFVLKDSWPLIKTKFAESFKSKHLCTINSKTIKLFKFGFLKVNETTDYSIPKVSEYLSVMGCLLLYELGYLQDCADFHTNFLSDNCSNFMGTYIQVHACLQLQAMDVSQLHIHKLSKIHLNQTAEKHFHLLKGKHAHLSGLAVNAHEEFTKILPSKLYINMALINILNNLKISVHSFYEEVAQRDSDAVIDKLARVLHCFQTFIANSSSERNCKYSAENQIFHLLHEGLHYQPEGVLSAIGKELLWCELHHLSSNTRYKATDITAKCYVNILCTYYKKDSSLQMLSAHSEIIHEAVVAFMLCDKIDEAEITCQILLEKGTVLREETLHDSACTQEAFLMERGVAAQMLMAHIKICQKKYDDAQHLLTRIKKTLLQVYFSLVKADSIKVSLLDAVIAKVYIWKALLFLKADYKLDALQCCQKAVKHNTGAEAVQACEGIARCLGTEFIAPPSPSTPSPPTHSLTLRYLLSIKCSV